MNKLPLFLSAAAFASLAVAQIAPITGENVVGFAQLTAAAGSKTILTIPFEACLEGGSGMLADLVSTSGLNAVSSKDDAADADQLVVLVDDGGPKYNYYFLKTDVGWTGLDSVILQPDGSLSGHEPPLASAFPISRGLGFWLKRPSAVDSTSVYLQGQYTSAAQVTAITPGLNLVGAARADAYNLNDLNWTDAVGGKLTEATTDKITVVNTDGSISQYFYFVAPGTWPAAYQAVSNKWVDQNYNANLQIPAGQGFWYHRRGAGSFNFTPDAP